MQLLRFFVIYFLAPPPLRMRQTAFICHNAIVWIFRHLFSGPAPFMRQCVFLRGPALCPVLYPICRCLAACTLLCRTVSFHVSCECAQGCLPRINIRHRPKMQVKPPGTYCLSLYSANTRTQGGFQGECCLLQIECPCFPWCYLRFSQFHVRHEMSLHNVNSWG